MNYGLDNEWHWIDMKFRGCIISIEIICNLIVEKILIRLLVIEWCSINKKLHHD